MLGALRAQLSSAASQAVVLEIPKQMTRAAPSAIVGLIDAD